MFHHSFPPSKLENADYSLFRQGVTPAWEDPAFQQGGRWVIKLEKVKAQSLDDLWLSLCLSAAEDEKKVMAVGREYRNILASTPGLQDLASKELTFEDFAKQTVTFQLARAGGGSEATAGVFQ